MTDSSRPAVLVGRLIEVIDDSTSAGVDVARLLASAGARVLLSAGANEESARAAAARLRAEGLSVHCRSELPAAQPDLVLTAAPSPAVVDSNLAEIVVVGMGIAVPGASSPERFWELLNSSEPVFTPPGDRLDLAHLWSADLTADDRTYARTAGFMYDFEPHPTLAAELAEGSFDALDFTAVWLRHAVLQATQGVELRVSDRHLFAVGLTPDGSQHLEQSLITRGVQDLLASAGIAPPAGLARQYPLGSSDPEELLPSRTARAALKGLPGTHEIVVVDTACSSSLYSIDVGVRALRAGDADVAICGGAFAMTAQNLVLFSKLRGLSRSGHVRSLDAAADGVLFSDGAALLALKTHARAIADGDEVLGFIAGFGGSSDGRGKAIYAPNAAGQRIALQRAWAAAGIEPGDLDWVVAHATGTPAGDRTEMTALADSAPAGTTWMMTSNKSLVGHTGWAAGAVSAVHALLAMRHQTIPAQREFNQLPAGAPNSVRVPTAQVSWPAKPDRARLVGISAMGFGGTNGHLVISDRVPRRMAGRVSEPARTSDVGSERPGHEQAVIVGLGWHLPGDPSRDELVRWATGGTPGWPTSFGAAHALPSPVDVRLAPAAIEAMDRSQLMALACLAQMGGDWATDAELRERTGVLVGHTGPTRSATRHALRYSLAELSAAVLEPAGISPQLVTEAVRALGRAANEDSYPGLMPNVIAARLAQQLNVHGLNMTLDSGRDSVQSALANAMRYLRDDELDMAVVLGVNATTEHVQARGDGEPAEAAVGFVVTRASVAERLGLPVLALLAVDNGAHDSLLDLMPASTTRDHRGAEGAIAVLRAVLGTPGTSWRIPPIEDDYTPALIVQVAAASSSEPRTDALAAAHPSNEPAAPAALMADFTRQRLVIRPRPADRLTTPAVAPLEPDTIVIVDRPESLAGVPIPAGCLVVALEPAPGAQRWGQVHYLSNAAQLADLLAEGGQQRAHVRAVLSDPAIETALKVHELLFVAVQANSRALTQGGSLAVIMLGSFIEPVPVPSAGLFGGLARSVQRELPDAYVRVVVTDTLTPLEGLGQLAVEFGTSRSSTVAYYRGSIRSEAVLEPADLTQMGDLRLPDQPVVLATGGASGLTAHLVDLIAAGSRPHSVWLLGSSPAPSGTPPPLTDRREAIRSLLNERPERTLPEAIAQYERALRDADRRSTIDSLTALVGAGGVHYLQCDVVDRMEVQQAVGLVVAGAGRVDVIVHGAGLTRSASLDRKQLSDFVAVRDVKVRGQLNLQAALAAAEQAPTLWCTVSSVSALVGLRGEADYCSANEYLMLDAAWARCVEHRDAVAMTTGLWLESGMAAANTPNGAYLARTSGIGTLTDQQGRQFYAAELAGRARPEALEHTLVTTWLSELDRANMPASAPEPQLLEAASSGGWPRLPAMVSLDGGYRTGSTPASSEAFLGAPLSQVDGRTRWSCWIGLDEHPYLLDHLVDGRPAIPGTFILELGIEAAATLAPDMVAVQITDVVYQRFIRAAASRWPREVLVEAVRDGAAVAVRVLSPATDLLPELEHTRMVVRLAEEMPLAPQSLAMGHAVTLAPNTYQLPGTPVLLSGVFDALVDPRFAEDGGSARCVLAVPPQPFTNFRLPSLLLDCLLRTAVLDGTQPSSVGVIVPTEIKCVRLYTTANDLQLAEKWPGGVELRHWVAKDGRAARLAAVGPDGRVLIEVESISGAERDRFDLLTDTWHDAGRRQ